MNSLKDALEAIRKGNSEGFGSQVGGTHYQDCLIQPMLYSEVNKLGPNAHSIIKYATRAGKKDGESFYKEMAKIRQCTYLWEEAWEAMTGETKEDYDGD